ncbi:MAG: DUF3526 domain-containing protein [bacterium]|nr:DUF3526 domain-containing protein [bacterium]
MIIHIAKKEIKEIARTNTFYWVLGIVCILGITSFFISYNTLEAKQDHIEEVSESERARWLGQGSKNPHSSAHYGTYAFKPTFALSVLDPGVEKYTGVSIFLEAHARNEAEQIAAADQTGLSRFGDITPDFILLFIIPLIIMVLSHRAITQEKELNTLRLIKMQGVSNFEFVTGKWLGNYLPFALLTTLIFSIAAVVVFQIDPSFDWKYLITMYTIYLVYFGIITSISIMVSAVSKSSGIALVSLLSIWILSCLAIPKIASSYTNAEYPYPSRHQFQKAVAADKQKGVDGHDPWSEASQKLAEETLQAYNVSALEDLPFNYDAYRMQKGEEHEARVYFKHYEQLKAIHQQQTEVYQKLAVLSPFLPVRFLSMSLAKTDYATHWNFTDAAERHRIEMQRILNTDFAENSKLGEWGYQADASLLAEIPEFNFESQDFSETIYTNRSNLLLLGLWSIASFGFLFIASKQI